MCIASEHASAAGPAGGSRGPIGPKELCTGWLSAEVSSQPVQQAGGEQTRENTGANTGRTEGRGGGEYGRHQQRLPNKNNSAC